MLKVPSQFKVSHSAKVPPQLKCSLLKRLLHGTRLAGTAQRPLLEPAAPAPDQHLCAAGQVGTRPLPDVARRPADVVTELPLDGAGLTTLVTVLPDTGGLVAESRAAVRTTGEGLGTGLST